MIGFLEIEMNLYMNSTGLTYVKDSIIFWAVEQSCMVLTTPWSMTLLQCPVFPCNWTMNMLANIVIYNLKRQA